MLTTMPMAAITAADYERLTREASDCCKKPVFHVPGKSLSGDWLDGYAEVLHSLAAQMDLGGGSPKAENVAIIGNLFDRNEADCTANVEELRRMVEALDLRLVSTWLSGGDFETLRAVRDAGTILSLPYGRKAAKRLAKRTGARLIELPLPFGLGDTEAFVETLAICFGREGLGRGFIDKELGRVIPRLEWVIPFVMQGRRFGYIGDPNLVRGIAEMAETVGAKLKFAVITNRPESANAASIDNTKYDTLIYPKMKSLVRYMLKATKEEAFDLLITNNMGILSHKGAILEFGFPSSFRHALFERPFLGFNGALAFIDSAANALRMQEAEVARQHLASSFQGGHLSTP
jgi:nitrogenase molybdenum-iron protein alpha/beta subunit